MLSGDTHSLPISQITIAPDRQRQDLRNIEDLAASIQQIGLINPIVVTPDFVLVAGERRLRASQSLGHTHIRAQFTTELSAEDAELIELEENVKREDLTWRETVESVARLYSMKARLDPEWTMRKAAAYLSISHTTLSNYLLVSRYLEAEDELVTNASGFSVALNAARRKEDRANAEETEATEESIDAMFDEGFSLGPRVAQRGTHRPADEDVDVGEAPTTILAPRRVDEAPILHLDFAEWAAAPLEGPRINFLHCDFPYGINYQKHGGGAGRSMGHYDDTREAFDVCMDALRTSMDRHIAPSAHLMFWFSGRLDLLHPVYLALEGMGWRVNPVPIIWHRSDNAGILPDPSRGPRQIYEVALIGSRGDRKIVQPVSNLFPHPKTKEVHPSEKPRPMLDHFFRMFVDESTVMLDPTCGSGNAVIAAHQRGARSVLGLEAISDHHESAVRNWRRIVTEDD